MPNDSRDSEAESVVAQTRSVFASMSSARLLDLLILLLVRIVFSDEHGENELPSRLGEVVAGELAG